MIEFLIYMASQWGMWLFIFVLITLVLCETHVTGIFNKKAWVVLHLGNPEIYLELLFKSKNYKEIETLQAQMENFSCEKSSYLYSVLSELKSNLSKKGHYTTSNTPTARGRAVAKKIIKG